MTHRAYILTAITIVGFAACGGKNTQSPARAPGNVKTATTEFLEEGAALLQNKEPIAGFSTYVNGFHFVSGHMDKQMEAHHYCSLINDDVTQCVIFDGNDRNAKLIGVEYIVSERLFGDLPADEKHLWHSHVYEVRSGELIAPGIPAAVEKKLMNKLVGTYGKTFHMWHTHDGQTLPLGIPDLMMGFTQDGQLKEQVLADRDRRFGARSSVKRRDRADLPTPSVDADADAWQSGHIVQIEPVAQAPKEARAESPR